MKNRIFLVAAAAASVMSVVTSCSGDAVETTDAEAVMLEAEIAGVAETRAAIEGTSLPAGSNYGLYVYEGGKAVKDNLKMSTSDSSTGYIFKGNQEVSVSAYYPYDEKGAVSGGYVYIYPGTTDFLRTVTSSYCTKSKPNAYLTLQHAMALVKFNIKVDSEISTTYAVELSSLGNVYGSSRMRLGSTEFEGMEISKSFKLPNAINASVKPGETASTEVLLIPQNLATNMPSLNVVIDKDSWDISKEIYSATSSRKWESGKVYTYNITISENKALRVESCTIQSWNSASNKGSVKVEEVE